MKNFHFKLLFLFLFFTPVLTGCTTMKQGKIQSNQEISLSTSTRVTPSVDVTKYDLVEVSKHNTQADCWQVVDGKIYDVTKYIPNHPGGLNSILKGCGKDATKMFDLQHKPKTKDMLKNYYLSELK